MGKQCYKQYRTEWQVAKSEWKTPDLSMEAFNEEMLSRFKDRASGGRSSTTWQERMGH